MSSELKLYNTLSRSKQTFTPLDLNKVRLYVCGPTVYDFPHVGNARPLIVFDLLFRLLSEIFGKEKVHYVRNITDVDDKILESAKSKNISIQELAKKVIKDFQDDCSYLNCLAPTKEPKATDHIQEMIELTAKLIEKKFAYIENRHVYFEVSKYKDYGSLSNKKIEELISGSRIEISKSKKSPVDFVLWKPSLEGEPGWDSPWGKGRPGWHLECSAMSEKYLGKEFDIHGGGLDLIFPHHENEIAQSTCANDTAALAKFWMHNGYVTVNKEKMSKSEGNFITINELKDKFDGQVIRLAMLSTQYTQPFDWNDQILENSYKTLNKWYDFYSDESETVDSTLLNSLKDDLNTPLFISQLHKLYQEAIGGDMKSGKKLSSACKLIGLFNVSAIIWKDQKRKKSLSEDEINTLIKERNLARDNKDFKRSDEIRDLLNDKDILIEDKENSTTWKYL
ncbi:cysteine--tRNA ligase [Pelagibacteraceae bacterium]|nr:cysteine--tRNA ligase [Pelagibacteraceae bacterium]